MRSEKCLSEDMLGLQKAACPPAVQSCECPGMRYGLAPMRLSQLFSGLLGMAGEAPLFPILLSFQHGSSIRSRTPALLDANIRGPDCLLLKYRDPKQPVGGRVYLAPGEGGIGVCHGEGACTEAGRETQGYVSNHPRRHGI